MSQSLQTVGEIAAELGVPFWRVRYVLAANRDIPATLRAGSFRMFDAAAKREIHKRIQAIDAKRGVVNAPT